MNVLRKEQTANEFDRLRSEVDKWHQWRKDEDSLNQYQSQLGALKTVLEAAALYLEAELNSLEIKLPSGDFYDKCREFDLKVLWLRKIWNFYREKFDQRDDPVLGPVLKAADEIVWSCYRQVFISPSIFSAENKQEPTPLPYIETSYSPESVPPELVPFDLKSTGPLQEFIRKLPIPLIKLPQSCVKSPWWLVYTGHEVGHQIQHTLLGNKILVELYQKNVQGVIETQTKDTKYAEKWGFWGQEIFADVFSVLVTGNWAIWVIIEFELQNQNAMQTRRPLYPSPIVRLSLLKAIADKLQLDTTEVLRGLNLIELAGNSEEVKFDLSFISTIVETAFEVLPGHSKTLAKLADFRAAEFQPGGIVSVWSKILRTANEIPVADKNLRSPRLAVCAALAAWANISGLSSEERASWRPILAEKTIKFIIASREEGTRGATIESKPEENLGHELAALLLNATQDTLENQE